MSKSEAVSGWRLAVSSEPNPAAWSFVCCAMAKRHFPDYPLTANR